MDFTLRPYQQSFAQDIALKLKQSQRVIACAATGSGKTKTFVWITHKAIQKGKSVLILTEARKIFDQITAEFKDTVEIKAGVKECLVYPGQIYVGMAQTLARRKKIIEQFQKLEKNLIIINDEAHVGTSAKLLKKLLNAYIIGFTATPRWKEAKHLTEIYNNISIGPQPSYLVEKGYLSPYYHYARVQADLDQLKIKNGEYDAESQKKAFEKAQVYEGIAEDLRRFKFYKCMVFCSNVSHAENTMSALHVLGYESVCVHSQSSTAEYDLYRFKNSPEVNICVSVGMLTKGFDYPPVDLVILNRATTSLPLYLQMCGRGSRIAKGKKKFTVIDYGGNAKRHGLWITDREWDKLWCEKKPPKQKLEMPSIVECLECGFVMDKSELVCPSCGWKQEKKKEEEKPKDTKLIELTDNYNQIRGKRLSELNPKQLHIYREFTGKKKFCLRIAKSKGEVFLVNFAKLCGYKNGFLKHNQPDTTLKFTDYIIK